MAVKHFLTLFDLSTKELEHLIQRAIELKILQKSGEIYEPLKNKVLGMIFEKSSTRTRVSFEAAMTQFGGSAIFLSPKDTQLGRGESIEDTARVLSRMIDGLMVRTFSHTTLERFAAYSQVPVINALTDLYHPCQLLADIQTYTEHRGSIQGQTVAWVGDGNNMCHSYISAAQQFKFKLHVATPIGYEPNSDLLKNTEKYIQLISDPKEAVKNADLVVTDSWASMGQEEEKEQRSRDFKDYQVNKKLMILAKKDALFMHCLPAYRGKEVTIDVIDGNQSVVWDEAENRLHAQKALLENLMAN
ncbi:ornithine carbamoyltransferase [Candidatus Nitrosacidococcus sp. I8]|uniref:ornithine carbamoyltransferase n=1 Tax=Candidatus Nitrosacidococcus sp. I8 TaxID=2942908 RepID=UPI00222697D1|nr:ornithine carbamoyltransferase [Candidatus Nitrosacidococcus sp. I8]CAH9019141.1 Ornithine carbamoyltransferase 1, anabolic [Candidatus Nitrosacidococcus sp. I8]